MTVLPFFDEHDVKLLRVLTDRGSEFCGNPERHEYELYLAVEDIDHSRTKTKSPQTNGIASASTRPRSTNFTASPSAKRCTVQSMSCRPTWTRWCFGKTPMQTFLDAMPMTKEKMIAA
jgi:hypothetical protein